MEGFKVLSVYHVAEKPEDCAKITLAPGAIKYVASSDTTVNGIDLKQVVVYFLDGEPLLVCISSFDLLNLENVIGGYSEGDC